MRVRIRLVGERRFSWWSVAVGVLAGFLIVRACGAPSDAATHRVESGPARNVALPGGGTTEGAECGTKYAFFPRGVGHPDSVAPRFMLLGYGGSSMPQQPTRFQLRASVGEVKAPGLTLDRRPTVSLEVRGPHGLIAGAHGMPVRWPASRPATVAPGGGLDFGITLPPTAVCPCHSWSGVLDAIDSGTTVLTLTLSDPAVGAYRARVRGPESGDLLIASSDIAGQR